MLLFFFFSFSFTLQVQAELGLSETALLHALQKITFNYGVGGHILERGGGTRAAGLTNIISRYLSYKIPYPTTIIFHLGACDLFRSHQGDIRTRVKNNLEAVRNLLPNTRLIWSDILPRREYRDEENKGAGKKVTTNINRFAHKICKQLGNAHVIKHPSITPDKASLYCEDKLHLSDTGSERFRQDLADALVFFNNNTSAIFWPPHENR